MAGKVSRFLLLQNTILIKMIKEIKRKWNQHTCIASPQNKDYWRNCWAFLELQTTRKTIQTDAVLGYKTSPLVCFYGIFIWTVCSVFCSSKCYKKAELTTKMFWMMLSTTEGTEIHWNPEPLGLQECSSNESWIIKPQMQPRRIDPSSGGGDPKHLDLRSPMHLSLASWATLTGFVLGFSFHQLKREMC